MDSTFASDSYSEHSNSSDVKQHRETNGKARQKTVKLISHVGVIACGKRFIYFLLFTITVGSAIAVYKYTSHDEKVDMELHTKHIASQVIEVYHLNAKKITDVCRSFAAVVSSHAIGTNATWPFVTVPAFESLAMSARESIGAQHIVVTPIVAKDQREQWEMYVANHGRDWIEEDFKYLEIEHLERPLVPSFIHSFFPEYNPVNDTMEGYDIYTPVWQYSPLVGMPPYTNFDTLRFPWWEHTFQNVLDQNSGVLSDVLLEAGDPLDDPATWPQSLIIMPIYNAIELSPSVDKMVATVTATLPWHSYFTNLLPSDIDPMILVISNSCGNSITYEIAGPNVTYIGPGDLHDPKYEFLGVTAQFNPLDMDLECEYSVAIYPTEKFATAEQTNNPLIYTIVVVCIFVFTVSVLVVYNIALERRQSKVESSAERSNAIVASLFPKGIVMRLMEDRDNREMSDYHPKDGHMIPNPNDPKGTASSPRHFVKGTRPIAELFASASVMFADLVGFTAWSSEREPTQVFELLEKIYSTFDHIAKRKGVFKVETIGDCYMAAAGLPEVRSDHATILACFARDCLRKMSHVVRKLECTLGPSTGDLKLRIGIHSGPITAGVLRGEKARFQLFGDTVNTAARMESTGQPSMIQLSAQTAQLIESADVDDIWVIPREDEVEAKGKGKLQTYWLGYESMNSTQVAKKERNDDSSSDEDVETAAIPFDSDQSRRERSIDWITQLLLNFLKRVMAMREEDTSKPSHLGGFSYRQCSRPLDEVVDVIQLQSQKRSYLREPSQIHVSEKVVTQLRTYIQEIASLYNSNYFHNFDHAIHVAMSVTKLLSRVVAPKTHPSDQTEDISHEYTFGITSDPLAQFAVTFAALIHDVDHNGVPNATLVQEKTANARRYRNQSIAEQNSVDIAWELLSFAEFADLRACICSNEEEFRRFRQLVVNSVMATDIADKELGAARKARWVKAFEGVETDLVVDANRKATIVIEHLIQASDVAHTMQHWHVYTRWNERFFHECYAAYKAGRTEKDPSTDWYTSEMGFFDFYIIPLAKKLKECQVFGVASDEYLNYAETNRKEWEMKGRNLVEGYIAKYNKSR